jgi:hypothetical protein
MLYFDVDDYPLSKRIFKTLTTHSSPIFDIWMSGSISLNNFFWLQSKTLELNEANPTTKICKQASNDISSLNTMVTLMGLPKIFLELYYFFEQYGEWKT